MVCPQRTETEWVSTIDRMNGKGCGVPANLIPGIANYLAGLDSTTTTTTTTTTVATTTTTTLAAALYYIETDHLDTPRQLSDSSGSVVWRWDSTDAFGANLPNEDPDGDGIKVTFNLRMPGQYADKETGTFYNYFRDYDPTVGRYIESDPIGLAGGLNTYGYVGGNPLSYVDPLGLDWYRPWSDQSTPYVAGRQTVPGFRPGGFVSKAVEHCVPAGRTFAQLHDEKLDRLVSQGVPDWRANIPTMPETYGEAVKEESFNSGMDIYRNLMNFFGIRGPFGQ